MVLSDTIILQGPTTTITDKEIIRWLNSFARINYRAFAKEFFKAGSVFNPKKINELIKTDFKMFNFNSNKVGIAQFETVGMSDIMKNKDKIFEALNKIYVDDNYDLIGLLISDITIQSSLFAVITKDVIKINIPWPEIEKNIFELKGILSRKKQVVPVLSRIF